jgi:glycosyltransferase involved in cell wall biosynthesis
VGHSNLDQRTLCAIRSRDDAQIWVLIHDVIPLEWPEFHDPARVARFEAMLRNIGQFADGLIYNSIDTQKRTRAFLSKWGVEDKFEIVAHLGMTPTLAHPPKMPKGMDPNRPSFLVLGTIEPRKNHKFLLEFWSVLKAEMVDQIPALYICGARGWDTTGVFDALDRHPLRNIDIFEWPNLTDAEVSGIMSHVCGLLSPSYAEGFGLTPLEGIQRGLPVICSDLDVYREFLGEVPVYCRVNDLDVWKEAIYDCLASEPSQGDSSDIGLPTWEKHFSSVFEQI